MFLAQGQLGLTTSSPPRCLSRVPLKRPHLIAACRPRPFRTLRRTDDAPPPAPRSTVIVTPRCNGVLRRDCGGGVAFVRDRSRQTPLPCDRSRVARGGEHFRPSGLCHPLRAGPCGVAAATDGGAPGVAPVALLLARTDDTVVAVTDIRAYPKSACAGAWSSTLTRRWDGRPRTRAAPTRWTVSRLLMSCCALGPVRQRPPGHQHGPLPVRPRGSAAGPAGVGRGRR
jgi:hypothetical protein